MKENILKTKFKMAVGAISLLQIINVAITIYCYIMRSFSEFKGALLGTVLGLIFFIIWLIIVNRTSLKNVMVLFVYSLGAFPIKLVLFFACVFGGLYLFIMDRYFFVYTFFIGAIASLIIEVIFILSINKTSKSIKK